MYAFPFRLLAPLVCLTCFTVPLTAAATPAPGKTVLLEFPELGQCAHKGPARCELYLPKDYTTDRRVPLVVWFAELEAARQR